MSNKFWEKNCIFTISLQNIGARQRWGSRLSKPVCHSISFLYYSIQTLSSHSITVSYLRKQSPCSKISSRQLYQLTKYGCKAEMGLVFSQNLFDTPYYFIIPLRTLSINTPLLFQTLENNPHVHKYYISNYINILYIDIGKASGSLSLRICLTLHITS